MLGVGICRRGFDALEFLSNDRDAANSAKVPTIGSVPVLVTLRILEGFGASDSVA
jgi:hypothetical protein